jgi:hypothetical protein
MSTFALITSIIVLAALLFVMIYATIEPKEEKSM